VVVVTGAAVGTVAPEVEEAAAVGALDEPELSEFSLELDEPSSPLVVVGVVVAVEAFTTTGTVVSGFVAPAR
jgi:hypothetical protein